MGTLAQPVSGGSGSSGGSSSSAPVPAVDSGLVGTNFYNGIPAALTQLTASSFAVSGSVLRIQASPGNGFLAHLLVAQALASADQEIETVVQFVAGTAANTSVGAGTHRVQANGDHHLFGIYTNASTLSVGSFAIAGGNPTAVIAATVIPGASLTQRVRVVSSVRGSSPTTHRVLVYDDASGDLLYDSGTANTTALGPQVAGSPGISGWGIAAGQEPFVFEFEGRSLPPLVGSLVFEGDSITNGQYASSGAGTCDGTSYPAVTLRSLGREWQGVNLGISGQTVGNYNSGAGAGMLANAAARAAANKSASLKNVVVIMGATNDLGLAGRTAAQAWADLQATYALWRAAGYKVVACTLLPSSHPVYIQNGVNFNLVRSQLNALIRAGSASYDALADVGGHWLIGQTGSEARRALYNPADLTHPIDAGYVPFGDVVAEAVRRLR